MKETFGFKHELWRTVYNFTRTVASSYTRHPTKRVDNRSSRNDDVREYKKNKVAARPPFRITEINRS